jgi:hypothetical protein
MGSVNAKFHKDSKMSYTPKAKKIYVIGMLSFGTVAIFILCEDFDRNPRRYDPTRENMLSFCSIAEASR